MTRFDIIAELLLRDPQPQPQPPPPAAGAKPKVVAKPVADDVESARATSKRRARKGTR